ncbi:hypothetical protein ACEPAH_5099 [Sanghuangporus vaninii]
MAGGTLLKNFEPTNYPKEALDYDPSKTAAVAAGAVYAILTTLLFIRLFRWKTLWGLCLPIGALCFSAGFFLRYASAVKTSNLGMFVDLHYKRRCHFPRAGNGGGLQAQDDTANLGRIIVLIGIIVQSLSYVVFYVLLIHSHRMISKDDMFDEYNFPWRLVHILHFSSVFIIIRCAYRVVELAEGNNGYLVTHEIFFYMLDTIPLFFATAIYVFFWPGQMIAAVSSREYPLMGIRPETP